MNRSALRAALGYFLLFVGIQLGVSLAASWIGFYSTYEGAGRMSQADIESFLYEFTAKHTMWILAASSVLTIIAVFITAKLGKFSVFAHSALSAKLPILMLLTAVVAGISANFWMSLVMSALPLPVEMMENYIQASDNLNTGLNLISIIAVGILAPVCEELIFRGMIFNRLSREFSITVAVLVQGLLFGAIHGDMLWIIYATVLGCVLGYVRVCTGSLKSSIAFHIAFNMASFGTFLLEGSSQTVLISVMFLSGALFALCMYLISKHKIEVLQ